MASTYLSRTPSSAGNQKTFTISTWVKFHQFTPEKFILSSGAYGGSRSFQVASGTNAQLDVQSNSNGVADYFIRTNRVFRDVLGWFHIVVAVDTTQATSTDRVKIYVNGVQETSFSSASYPSLNFDTGLNSTQEHQINGRPSTSDYGSVSHSHFHLIDGTAYDASAFGETDATTGIWKPKTAPSVTYGTNGFFLKFENSGSMGTDSSPNGNNLTVNGTLTQTVDTPSNVFCTGNPLNVDGTGVTTLINGNLTHTNNYSSTGTLAISKGKWYFEIKRQDNGGTITNWQYVGFRPIDRATGTGRIYRSSNGDYYNGSAYVSYGASWGDGDIIGIALDYDNDTIEFYKNGVSQGSQTSTGLCDGTLVTPIWQCSRSSGSPYLHANFGNGYFGTTAVSSATSDESGLGIFEHTVPSGYNCLCTKNINTYG